MPDYYATLGLQPNASEKDIKKAYRKLAHEHHPDKGGSQEKFVEITEAYEVLTGKKQAPIGGPPPNDPFGSVWDFMNNINHQTAGQWRKPRPPSRDEDIHFPFRMSVDEIRAGGTLKLAYKKSIDCRACNGVGGSGKVTCARCGGQGQIHHLINHGGIRMQTSTVCSHCSGEGEQFMSKCTSCDGHGWTAEEHEMLVDFKLKEFK